MTSSSQGIWSPRKPGRFNSRPRRLQGGRLPLRDECETTFTAGLADAGGADTAQAPILWEQADAALYEGKRTGGSRVVVFDEVAEQLSLVTPDKVHAVRSLLAEPRVEIALQPIWKLDEDDVLGFEALARPWSGYDFDGPADAFAVAERIGRAYNLDAICRESALARAGDATRLRRLGFRLALDDVGASNAGLEMLRDMPVDFVKIDRSVIAAAIADSQTQAVLVAIVAYARRTGAFVIAEGIESEQILSFVLNAHELAVMQPPAIEGGQGFLLGRPSPDLTAAPRPRQAAAGPAT